MKIRTLALFANVAALALSQRASAQILFTDNFNGYADNAAMGAIWNIDQSGFGANPGIFLSNDPLITFGKTVERTPGGTGRMATAIPSTTPTVTNPLKVTWSFYDGGGNARPITSLDLRRSGGSAAEIGVGLTPILNIGGTPADTTKFQASINGGTNGFNLAASRPLVPGWTKFDLVVGGGFASLYVNDSLTPDANFNNRAVASGFYDRLRLGNATDLSAFLGPRNVTTMWDEITVAIVPEPGISALTVAGTGILLLSLRNRRN